ncbi:hypothetical protein AKJ65_00590 [candidate division MSBL1 archaeon SCGC-AAA259E19]|uniref:Uncharacterized protein n=1 Tax=candidate division MSBL1 archaeon SCGC-AAA259E19 TaxID=1698264 RepID=A0A133UNM9_9EURY|nr:hypothetical protein AKJ65_00590 [candidate division MSBL1 archaeon SCGC-AAA259E19]
MNEEIGHPEIDFTGEVGKEQYHSGTLALYSKKEKKILLNFTDQKDAAQCLNHEFMHHLLFEMFGEEVCDQFDASGLSYYLDHLVWVVKNSAENVSLIFVKRIAPNLKRAFLKYSDIWRKRVVLNERKPPQRTPQNPEPLGTPDLRKDPSDLV